MVTWNIQVQLTSQWVNAVRGYFINFCYTCIMKDLELPLPEEFSFEENLVFLKRSPKELLHQVENKEVYKLLSVDGERVLFKVGAGRNNLKVKFLLSAGAEKVRTFVHQYIVDWFDLDRDLKPFYAMASLDPHLAELVKKHFGYRIMGQPDLYESLVWAVLGQQINLSFAYTLKQQFVRAYGDRLVFNGREYFIFPNAEKISQLEEEELLRIQFSRQKSRYTIRISEAFASGEISKEKLAGMSLEEAKNVLMKIKGIGNWTANYALMKTFRYPDAFPLEDAGLKNAVRKCLNLERSPTWDEIKKLFRKYKGWEAYATLYLWRTI